MLRKSYTSDNRHATWRLPPTMLGLIKLRSVRQAVNNIPTHYHASVDMVTAWPRMGWRTTVFGTNSNKIMLILL